jgi:thiol-disulfide isomerase/thioredoxin
MLNLQLGPLALPLNPLLMAGAWWLAAALTDHLMRKREPGDQRMAARSMLLAPAVGLIAARMGFVAIAWEAYASDPLAVLHVRDGGWMPWLGLCAALSVLAGVGWRHAGVRRALASGSAAGLAAWALAATALGVHERPPLPPISLQALDGTAVDLHQQAGHPMVVNLWATWCGPCREEMPVLAAAQQRHTGVRFVFANQGESAAVIDRWLKHQPYRLNNVVLDPQSRLLDMAQSTGMPTTLFIDARGRIVERYLGVLSTPSLAARLADLGSTPSGR